MPALQSCPLCALQCYARFACMPALQCYARLYDYTGCDALFLLLLLLSDYDASLHKMTNQDTEKEDNCTSLELECPPGFRAFHMFELCRFPMLWGRVVTEVKKLQL
jgi:hypothetical protein